MTKAVSITLFCAVLNHLTDMLKAAGAPADARGMRLNDLKDILGAIEYEAEHPGETIDPIGYAQPDNGMPDHLPGLIKTIERTLRVQRLAGCVQQQHLDDLGAYLDFALNRKDSSVPVCRCGTERDHPVHMDSEGDFLQEPAFSPSNPKDDHAFCDASPGPSR